MLYLCGILVFSKFLYVKPRQCNLRKQCYDLRQPTLLENPNLRKKYFPEHVEHYNCFNILLLIQVIK